MTDRRTGFLHWVFPAMLGLVALNVLLSGRDLSQTFAMLQAGPAFERTPAIVWSQRVVSMLLLAVAAESILRHFAQRKPLPSLLLALAFTTFWFATVALPAVFGSHPRLSHEYLYTLAIGLAAVLAGPPEFDKVVATSRNALFAFLLASVALIPVQPTLVLDTSYGQGLLPGLPRLGGLALHAVSMGMLAQTALLCLWCRPFRSAWLTALGWLLGGAVLFLAQSKSAWSAFFLCSICMLAVRQGGSLWKRMGDPRQGSTGVLICLGVIGIVLAFTAWALVADVREQAAGFVNTAEGAQLLTLTGRDRIWAVAIEEWRMSPLFGYGPDIWNHDFRTSIGMPYATHGHNQFMDLLARSGGVGAAALVLYATVLLVLAVRYAKATGGFSLALFVALALRSVSEVPLVLFGYGTELFSHLLLLVALASAAAAGARSARTASTHSIYRVAS